MKKILLGLIALSVTILTLWADNQNYNSPVYGFEDSCNELSKFDEAIKRCYEINGNNVCYGNQDAQVEPKPFRFYSLKDRRPLPDLTEIRTQNANGVVILDLHIPGQQPIVRAVVFGQLDLKSIDPRQHIFTLKKGSSDFVCTATPPGMVIRTEPGVAGQININGITIRLKSSAFITMESDDVMIIANLEGQVNLDSGIDSLDLPTRYQIKVQLSNPPQFLRPATLSPFFDSSALQWLITDLAGMKRIQNTNENPNKDAACVQKIKFGKPITEQNVNSGQECLFQFCAKKGDVITAQMDALDPQLNPWIDLRGPDEKIVSFNNDIDREKNKDSLLCNVGLPVDGCYTIVARSHRNDSFGRFRLTLDRQTACVPPPSPCIGLHPDDPDCPHFPTTPPDQCFKTITVFVSPLTIFDSPLEKEVVVPC